jgi:FtsH-binding integral membrane protein
MKTQAASDDPGGRLDPSEPRSERMKKGSFPMRADSMKQTSNDTQSSHERTLEITALGMIACLIIAFGTLVTDGTLPLSQYLFFVALLLVSVSGLVWRIFKLAPARATRFDDPDPRRK